MKPEDVAYHFADYWNQRDARGLASLFTEDADFINVVGIWWQNREDIYKAHDYGLRVIFNESDLKVTRTKVREIAKDAFIVHARMRLKGQTPAAEADEPGTRFNIFSFVVLKQKNGHFLIVSAHNTDIVPGKETNVSTSEGIKPTDYRKS